MPLRSTKWNARLATFTGSGRRRRFVARDEFAGRPRNAATLDLDAFRADQDAAIDQETADPYDR